MVHPLSGVVTPSDFDLETGRLCVMASRHKAGLIVLTRDTCRRRWRTTCRAQSRRWGGRKWPAAGTRGIWRSGRRWREAAGVVAGWTEGQSALEVGEFCEEVETEARDARARAPAINGALWRGGEGRLDRLRSHAGRGTSRKARSSSPSGHTTSTLGTEGPVREYRLPASASWCDVVLLGKGEETSLPL